MYFNVMVCFMLGYAQKGMKISVKNVSNLIDRIFDVKQNPLIQF